MTLTGYLTTLPADTLLDSGVLYFGSAKFGVTDGAPKFDPKRSLHQVPFDGRHAPIKGLDRIMQDEPVITATIIEFGPASSGNQIVKLEPGGTVATVGGVITTVPAASGSFVGTYLTDLRMIFERGSGGYAAIYFPVGLCNKWDLQGANKGEAKIAVEFVGRVDMSTGATSDPAYRIETRTALP